MTTSWIAALLLASLGAAGDEKAAKDGGQAKSVAVADQALAPWQERLLDVAFQAASALPDNPHLKNRCRMQSDVVTACFTLDQPQRALRCIEKIGNWRRGVGYADYAFWCAKHGDTAEVERYLTLAREVADAHHGDDAQDWERERILGGIAATRLVLQAARIDPVRSGLADVDAARALFDEQREKIVNIYRARVLRALAESYQEMGNAGDALRCYIRAVDAGVENPNSRPRADDLAATCASMAIHGVSPDGELWDRLTSICDKLGPPW